MTSLIGSDTKKFLYTAEKCVVLTSSACGLGVNGSGSGAVGPVVGEGGTGEGMAVVRRGRTRRANREKYIVSTR